VSAPTCGCELTPLGVGWTKLCAEHQKVFQDFLEVLVSRDIGFLAHRECQRCEANGIESRGEVTWCRQSFISSFAPWAPNFTSHLPIALCERCKPTESS